MATIGQMLLQLQDIDLTIRNHHQRLDEITTELMNNDAVQAATLTVTKAEAVLSPLQANLRDFELQVDTTKDKRSKTEQRLYSGTVTNPKELQDMQQEMQALDRRQAQLEDQMLEVMVAVEDARDTLQEAETQLAEVTKQAEKDNKDLLAEKQSLQSEIADLQAQRDSMIVTVPEDALERYERMRPQKAHRPIAIMRQDDTCGACGITQTSTHAQEVRRAGAMLTCTNCGRILVTE